MKRLLLLSLPLFLMSFAPTCDRWSSEVYYAALEDGYDSTTAANFALDMYEDCMDLIGDGSLEVNIGD